MTDHAPTTHPIEPVTQFTLNHDDPYHRLALSRIHAAALEAYDLNRSQGHEEALYAAVAAAGRSYAAAALNRAAWALRDKLDEDAAMALGDTAAALDLAVVEDMDGANGPADDTPGGAL